ncbi:ABC transporter (ZnuC) [Nitrosopumilaceae archaeon]|nr:metal ABC transporter ATP-binding protein [Nitrosopumilus sp.]CAI9831124.1 ABC transporter (ZnuC) [Nitrosopumilaceae archaeon]MDA7944887.1 metal ABC transporter ATP-binding protein [Nitrosopumilus sp.]MDA7954503.1 metal ABC transporter ATP-binding protein [Nitrosopumilus sp.]MDA7973498.1 metal ABC transporter ATP-binding protein [Nitrosopumilus sp.]
MHAIEVEGVTAGYPQVRALEDVSFAIDDGDLLGIIGPNGAGKSTLFDILLGLNTDYEGTVRFFGSDIRGSRDHLRRTGYVPQDPGFESNFPATVRDVVSMGLRGKDRGRVDEMLKRLWIHELGLRRIGELSVGQQQRVMMAKALVGEPRILVLDEPAAGADVQSSELFYSILRGLNGDGITIVWSSHDLDAVSRLSNRVACLNRTLFFHGEADSFFSDESLVRQYSEATMQAHMREHADA